MAASLRLRVVNGLVRLVPMVLALAASCAAVSASAQLYKWADERGVVTYSDRKPLAAHATDNVVSVPNRLSIYSPDPALLQAIQAARRASNQAQQRAEPARAGAQLSAVSDPCSSADCGAVSGVAYPYPVDPFVPFRHRPRPNQAVLPAGAIAGTINAPGIIPGNTGTTNVGPPVSVMPLRRGPFETPRFSGDPLLPRH